MLHSYIFSIHSYLVFVIWVCVHLYKFLNYEWKVKSRMAEWRKKWQNIKAEWFVPFAHENGLFKYNICLSAKMPNIFVSGKDVSNPQKYACSA